MRKLLALLAVILFVSPGVSRVGAQEVTVDVFYRSLEPHGEWIETTDYGYVWSPKEVAEDWRPYTVGNWAYTDAGWTWVSEEPFGWATYHYGRWVRLESSGWVWVPDTEWAPAWVSWRRSPKHIGWAPLPPEARFRKTVGIKNWADTYYDIGPEYYSFVEVRQFGAPRLARVVAPPRENVTIIRETKNITNITVVNNYVFNGGPEYEVVVRESVEPIRRLRIERRMDIAFNRDTVREDVLRATVAGETLRIVAPDVRFTADVRPARVARRVERVQVDRGWRIQNVEQRQLEQLRAEIRKDAPRPPSDLPPQPKFERAAIADVSGDRGRQRRAGQDADTERLSVPGTPGDATQTGATVGTPGDDRATGGRAGRGERRGEMQPGTAQQDTTQPGTATGATTPAGTPGAGPTGTTPSATAPGAEKNATGTPAAAEDKPKRGSQRERSKRGEQTGATSSSDGATPPATTPGATPSLTTPGAETGATSTSPDKPDSTTPQDKERDRSKRRDREQPATVPSTTTPAPAPTGGTPSVTPPGTETTAPGTTPSTTEEKKQRGTQKENDRLKRREREESSTSAVTDTPTPRTTPQRATPGTPSTAAPMGDEATGRDNERDADRAKRRDRGGREQSEPSRTGSGAPGSPAPGASEADQPRKGRGERDQDSPASSRPQTPERSPSVAGASERPQVSSERRGPSEENVRTGRGDKPARPEQPDRPQAGAPDRGGAGTPAVERQQPRVGGESGGSERPGRAERGGVGGGRPEAAGERGGGGGGRPEAAGERGGGGRRGAEGRPGAQGEQER